MSRRSSTHILQCPETAPAAPGTTERAPLDISLDTLPPSLNNLYATIVVKGRSRRVLSSVATAWKRDAALLIRSAARRQGWKAERKIPLSIEIVYVSPAVLRWDLDGKGKLLIDACCEALGLDDRYVMSLRQSKARGPVEKVSLRVWTSEVLL